MEYVVIHSVVAWIGIVVVRAGNEPAGRETFPSSAFEVDAVGADARLAGSNWAEIENIYQTNIAIRQRFGNPGVLSCSHSLERESQTAAVA